MLIKESSAPAKFSRTQAGFSPPAIPQKRRPISPGDGVKEEKA